MIHVNEQRNPFETENYRQMDGCRDIWLRQALPGLMAGDELITALDAGAGQGYFSGLMANEFGLEVTGFDARPENVKQALESHPGVRFYVDDVEEARTIVDQHWDLVLCFGLLYHLENPFRAIRNLQAVTKKMLLLETQVAPEGVGAALVEEAFSPDQALRRIALVPNEAVVVKMLYAAGFAAVYKAEKPPNGREFNHSLLRRRSRVILLATTADYVLTPGLNRDEFRYLPEQHPTRVGFDGRLATRWLAKVKSRILRQARP